MATSIHARKINKELHDIVNVLRVEILEEKLLNPYAPWLLGPSSSCSVWESYSIFKEKSQILRSTYFMSSITLGTFIYLFHLKTSVFYILIIETIMLMKYLSSPFYRWGNFAKNLLAQGHQVRKEQIWSLAPTTQKSTLLRAGLPPSPGFISSPSSPWQADVKGWQGP